MSPQLRPEAQADLATAAAWYEEQMFIAFASLGWWPFLVFQDQAKISRLDVARLTNVGDESISSLSAIADMKRKLERLDGQAAGHAR